MYKKLFLYIFLIFELFCYKTIAHAKSTQQSIKQNIIEQSIESYDGKCPCPYHAMSNGRSCGQRSAYSRKSGEAPLCYERDVTESMINEYIRLRDN